VRSSRVVVQPGAGNLLVLNAAGMMLGPVVPLLNGEPLPDWELVEWTAGDGGMWEWRFGAALLGAGSFHLRFEAGDEGEAPWLRYWLEGLPADLVVDSFGIRCERVTGVRAVLRQGYHSWDGSALIAVDELPEGDAVTGYALAQLLPERGADNLVLGFDRHDRFQQTFAYRRTGERLSLDVVTWWDRKALDGARRAEGERLVLLVQPGVEAGLRRWARVVATEAPEGPRVDAQAITGWCSWYNHYATIDETLIRAELRSTMAARDEHGLPLRVFQIDDGFTPEMGDWLDVKPQFPRGVKLLLDEIRAAGFRPGLWIAPFMVGNRSRQYQEHPDWVVGDRETGGPLVQLQFYGEFRWHKRSEEYYILDATHPEAFAYLRTVFRTWAREWGCDYFKTDFMHFGSAYGPERAVYHTPGLTRVVIWRRVAEMIREEIGDALWLGCGCPLWPAVGLVDGMRIGRDMGAKWAGEQSAQSILGDLQWRNFANGILWQLDPDCLLLRDRFHYLSDGEIQALALYTGLAAGVLMTSDTLAELPPERLALLRFLLELPPGDCRFPLLGAEQAKVVVQLRELGGTGETLLFLFNTGEEPVADAVDLKALGLDPPAAVSEWPGGKTLAAATARIQLELAPHEGRLLRVAPQSGQNQTASGT
jgi:alpha-galactosidase